MCKRITLFGSLKDDENNAVLPCLYDLRDKKGVQLEVPCDTGLLDEYIRLPSIYTDEGERAYGVEGIKRFVEAQLARAA